jgi:hypothetical protein
VTGNLREQLSGPLGRGPELAQPREAEILWAPTALLETKFYMPRPRRGLVSRPRLSERLDRGTASKLMLVSAPAGFGKTTLLTEWLAAGPGAPADERLAAWLSLDRGDNDPASFWAYVIAALRTVAAGIGESALALLQAPQPPPVEAVLTALLNELAAIAGDIMLVLDDYHVIDVREVQDGMAFLLDHLPPGLHVVIASRADPALPLARLRARGPVRRPGWLRLQRSLGCVPVPYFAARVTRPGRGTASRLCVPVGTDQASAGVPEPRRGGGVVGGPA